MPQRNVAGSDGDLVDDLADVGAGVERAGLRVVGEEQVVQRQRCVAAASRRARARCLTRILVIRLRPGDVLAEEAAVVLDEAGDLPHRDRRGCAAPPRGPRARRRAGRRRRASESLNWRTVLVVLGQRVDEPLELAGGAEQLVLVVVERPVSLPKFSMVWWNCAPWPPKFLAVESSRSVSAPFLLAPFGPERDGEVVEAGVDLVELERRRGAVLRQGRRRSASTAPPGVDRRELDEPVADDRRAR